MRRAREVLEETGVRIDEGSVRYLKSQPWPFPQSCMVAFRATADCDQELVLDDELLEAKWWDRPPCGKLVACPAPSCRQTSRRRRLRRTRPSSSSCRPKKSSRGELIEAWLSEDEIKPASL